MTAIAWNAIRDTMNAAGATDEVKMNHYWLVEFRSRLHFIIIACLTTIISMVFVNCSWAEACAETNLFEAAAKYRMALQQIQNEIKISSIESALGVSETVQFDRASHGCHSGPAQSYRKFGEAKISKLPNGEVQARYSFELFYRQALHLEELFKASWEEGSGGFLIVEFQCENGKWIVSGSKESIR